ncbi:hypothetical protein CLOM_g3171 [Closterium sp. NIES-68]|nr:hypothetical protein CLOM_g3171 [Closterium sp. NIES-68]
MGEMGEGEERWREAAGERESGGAADGEGSCSRGSGVKFPARSRQFSADIEGVPTTFLCLSYDDRLMAGASGGGGREGADGRDGRELSVQCVGVAGEERRAAYGSVCETAHRNTQPAGSDPPAAAVPGTQRPLAENAESHSPVRG